MDYDIAIPIIVGVFTFVTAGLIAYFLWLIGYISSRPRRTMIILALFHIVVMVVGLFLTGFSQWL